MSILFPRNMIDAFELEIDEIPNDFLATVNYVVTSNMGERELDMLMCYYRDGMTLEAIGQKYSISKQRVSAILNSVKTIMCANSKMLRYGIKEYMVVALNERVENMSSLIAEKEREEIANNAYKRGYDNGKLDALSNRDEHRADLDTVRKIPVSAITLSVRLENCFSNYGIKTIGDILDRGDSITNMHAFGLVSFKELIGILEHYDVNPANVFPHTYAKFKLPTSTSVV